ncbi:MAG: response regulator [Alkalispirochaetaceae bacterium]
MKVLVVDDERSTLLLVKAALEKRDHEATIYESARDALRQERLADFDCILSDYFMPEMSGSQFLAAAQREAPEVPFVFLSGNDDLENAVDLLTKGAADYIRKPIIAETLLFRVEKAVEAARLAKLIERIEQERQLLELENKKLVNWRNLYASKDARQTEQMIRLLSRTINQAGGFMWIDLLEGSLEKLEDGNFRVPTELVDMILSSGKSQKQIFDYITFVGSIDEVEIAQERLRSSAVEERFFSYVNEELSTLAKKHGRAIRILEGAGLPSGFVEADENYLREILWELTVNAIKYSPEGSTIYFFLEEERDSSSPALAISVRNYTKDVSTKDSSGKTLHGIPYDYSELVFDLFFTIESFPVYLDEEKWSDGTGLYLARRLIRRQGGWIRNASGVDYSRGESRPFVTFRISFPLREE